jgi:D-xylose transport system substrate-binding protein
MEENYMVNRKVVTLIASAAIAIGACSNSASPGASGGGGGGSATGTVSFLLPEKQTARYEAADNPLFTAKFKALCPSATLDYANAGGDDATQLQQGEAAIAKGAKVIVLDANDADAAGKIVTEAQAKGIKVVSYDRLVKGNSKPDYYVEFDSSAVGKLQGDVLLAKLTADGKTMPKLVWINGSPKDNNASLFKAGAHTALDGKVTIVKEDAMANWKAEEAQAIMEAAIATAGKDGFDGVYVANDGGAGGAIAAMKSNGVDPKTKPTTGQDAELAGIQRIVLGDQFMTVYKPIKTLAEESAAVACDLLNGKTPDASKFNATENNGTADIITQKIAVVGVTLDGKTAGTKSVLDSVIADGFYTAAAICTTDFAAACTAAGVK